MKLPVKNIKGQDQGEVQVSFPLVEVGRGTQAVHDTIVAYRAAQRMGTACTKNVGEVAGTNRKPWRQKGTGRARAGSFRSPLWRGGGVVFGPKPRDFGKNGDVLVLDELKLASPKTRDFIEVLNQLELNGTALVVVPRVDQNLVLASRNLAYVEVTTGDFLNSYQVLRSDKLLFTRDAFDQLQARLTD